MIAVVVPHFAIEIMVAIEMLPELGPMDRIIATDYAVSNAGCRFPIFS